MSSSESQKLLNCPFCGGDAETCSHYFEEGDMTLWQVRCKERPYSVEHPCYTADSFISFETEAEAVEAWNTRAERTFPDDTQEAQYHLCELERITGETWRPERTCKNITDGYVPFHCSGCDCVTLYDEVRETGIMAEMGMLDAPNYCPNCGCKVNKSIVTDESSGEVIYRDGEKVVK